MEVFKKDLKNNISVVENELVVKSGESKALTGVATHIVSTARSCVAEANQTASVDERMSKLVAGLQEIVVFIEVQAEKANSDILLLKNKIEVLNEVLNLADKSVEDEKKMEDTESV